MKEHPIIFSTEMVQAILDGRKTMTRRIVKGLVPGGGIGRYTQDGEVGEFDFVRIDEYGNPYAECKSPYGKSGDILWVRERICNLSRPHCDPEYIYYTETLDAEDYNASEWKWKPSIHMPRTAARIFLEVVSIRVERLQEISKDDAIREGIEQVDDEKKYGDKMIYRNYQGDGEAPCSMDAVGSFMTLWSKINGWQCWYSNPWVWVVEFKRREDYK